jgi:hypothetical protein
MWKDIHKTQKQFLAALSPQEIADRIRRFRRRDVRSMTDTEVADAIVNIFSVDVDGQSQMFILRRQNRIPFGARLFRARSAKHSMFPLSCAVDEADAWEPPAGLIKTPGRLNKGGESLLYTCLNDPYVSLVEIRAGLNQPVAVFCYRARREVVTSELGEPVHHPQLTSDELFKLNLFEDFLYEEFTREVGKGTEHLYRASEPVPKRVEWPRSV